MPHEPVRLHEGVIELDVSKFLALGLRLEANGAESGQVDSTGYLNLVVAPLLESVPDAVITSLGNDVGNLVSFAAEVALNGFGAEALEVEVRDRLGIFSLGTSWLHLKEVINVIIINLKANAPFKFQAKMLATMNFNNKIYSIKILTSINQSIF